MDSLQAVIQKAIDDPDFAAQLKREARAAQKGEAGGKEWETLMGHFTATPEALSNEPQFGWTTITTVTSPECLTTTTTTGH
jgi:hypothetical protein